MEATAGGRWADFWLRFASAAILGPIALICLWRGGWAWAVFIGVAMAGLGAEWGGLFEKASGRFSVEKLRKRLLLPGAVPVPTPVPPGQKFFAELFYKKATAFSLSLLLLVVWLCEAWGGAVPGLAAIIAMTGIAAFFFGPFAAAGIPYAGIGGISLLWLRLQPDAGLFDTLFLVAVIWSTDIGAYLAGRLVGGPKMAPRISPGKTWSGAVGGFCAAGLAGMVLAGSLHALPAACALSVFAQAGDLLESAIKRKLGVKDSGRTIPGHGGLFDRLDGFLAAAPVAAILALGVHGGLPLWG